MNASDHIPLKPIDQPVDHIVSLPGSKSITNRALLIAALAQGVSTIDGLLLADDTRLMIEALRQLGVSLEINEDSRFAKVTGCGGHWPTSQADLFCGNAGTVIRFLTAACCLGAGDYHLDGVPRMRKRPIGDLVYALRELGANIGCDDRQGFCPLTIRAAGLRGGRVLFPHTSSSQFISALLIASPLANEDVYIDVTDTLPSRPYVDMTLSVMRAFGCDAVEQDMRKFIIPAQQTYSSTTCAIEPDATAASYFFAAAAITGGRITIDRLGSESCQGDVHFVKVLQQMGCQIEEGIETITVTGPADGKLCGIEVDLNDMPDVAPTLAVLAAFAKGPTHIQNVANLRIKESDRLQALANELAKMEVETMLRPDGISILPSRFPEPAAIETYNDHRLAMSFALAGLRLDGMIIRDAKCVKKTFPEFFSYWSALGGDRKIISA